MPATKLKANDVIQIFVKDSAGNENPVTSTTYHDATFAAATQYTVAPAIGPTAPTEPEHLVRPIPVGAKTLGPVIRANFV